MTVHPTNTADVVLVTSSMRHVQLCSSARAIFSRLLSASMLNYHRSKAAPKALKICSCWLYVIPFRFIGFNLWERRLTKMTKSHRLHLAWYVC